MRLFSVNLERNIKTGMLSYVGWDTPAAVGIIAIVALVVIFKLGMLRSGSSSKLPGSTSKLPEGFKADGGCYPEITLSRCKGEIEVFTNYFSICSQNTMMVLAEKG